MTRRELQDEQNLLTSTGQLFAVSTQLRRGAKPFDKRSGQKSRSLVNKPLNAQQLRAGIVCSKRVLILLLSQQC